MLKLRKRKRIASVPGFGATSELLASGGDDDILFAAFFLDQKGNFGDRIIPWLAIDLIDHFLEHPASYRLLHVRNGPAPTLPAAIPGRPKALVFGPGGLICGREEWDTSYPWFVNFSAEDARRLHEGGTRLFFWGTGVNRWSRKRQLSEPAREEIATIFQYVDTAFLRGTADMAYLASLLPEASGDKLRYQACPSFFIPELRHLARREATTGKVAINVAADQLAEFFRLPPEIANDWRRHKQPYYQRFAALIAPLVDAVRAGGFTPVFFCSTREDAAFAADCFPNEQRLETNAISAEFIRLEKLLTGFRFAVGMRLHAWLPFLSLGIPSLFLTPFGIRASMPADLGLEELSCPIAVDEPIDLAARFQYLVDHEEDVRRRIIAARQREFERTEANVRRLKVAMDGRSAPTA